MLLQLSMLKVSKMAKPNYSFEKRQRELAKTKKKEEKRQQKIRAKEEQAQQEQAQEEQMQVQQPGATSD